MPFMISIIFTPRIQTLLSLFCKKKRVILNEDYRFKISHSILQKAFWEICSEVRLPFEQMKL